MQYETAHLIDAAKRASWLEGKGRDARDVRRDTGNMRGTRDGIARIALRPHESDVIGCLVPDGRPSGCAGGCHGGDRGSILRFDDNELCCGVGRVQSLGHDERNWLANGTDAIANEHGTSGLMRLLAIWTAQIHAARKIRQPIPS